MGNVIVGAEGLRAVLDWELVHIANRWKTSLVVRQAWRFRLAQTVAGVVHYGQLFEAYEAAGVAPSTPVWRWWEVLGTMKWGIMCIMQANAHPTGVTRSHELAAIGRRVCENEHDLFLELEGRW